MSRGEKGGIDSQDMPSIKCSFFDFSLQLRQIMSSSNCNHLEQTTRKQIVLTSTGHNADKMGKFPSLYYTNLKDQLYAI